MPPLSNSCSLCGSSLNVLRHPIRRLRWTRYWLTGLKSLLARPLKECRQCGAMFTWEEELIAEGVVETVQELKLRNLRDDLANMRNSFGTLFLAGEFAALWMWFGPAAYDGAAPVVASAVAIVSLMPFAYFNRRVQLMKKQLKQSRTARTEGRLRAPGNEEI